MKPFPHYENYLFGLLFIDFLLFEPSDYILLINSEIILFLAFNQSICKLPIHLFMLKFLLQRKIESLYVKLLV